ncbi:two component system response regulator [Salmonella enterica subsp. salamae]|nr:two component system response regulator [Salmonella enterica subsp. salamae]ECJ2280092.1 two component system response regulator [Salmonella enterica subsp. salamae]HCC0886901.1 two component system response regulator [Salmonella enterica]
MKEYKIVLVDDHEIIVNGIMNALLPWHHFKIVEHVKNGLDVYNACCSHEPDIIILDLSLPGVNGLDIIPQLHHRWPAMNILVYTAYQQEYMAIKTLAAGAHGYVLKSSSQQVLLAALQMIAVNKRYIDPALNREAILTELNSETQDHQLLTLRERQVLKLIDEGYTNQGISEKLHISIKTVETHRMNMMRKLQVHKVTELLNCARRMNLIEY